MLVKKFFIARSEIMETFYPFSYFYRYFYIYLFFIASFFSYGKFAISHPRDLLLARLAVSVLLSANQQSRCMVCSEKIFSTYRHRGLFH